AEVNGMPQALSDREGNTVWRPLHTGLFGVIRREESRLSPYAARQNLRFAGQYYDEETGLHYNTLRYYDPGSGSFTQPDPIGLRGGINLYAYGPNPLTWVDPLGLANTALSELLGLNSNSIGVYRYTDKTGHIYVGSTVDQDFITRLGQHIDSGKLPIDQISTVQVLNMDGHSAQSILNTEASEIVRNGGRITDGGTTSNIRAPSGTRENFKNSAWVQAESAQESRFGSKC
ncbi:RHS repeat-associated core domain-containing protein, partial [Erwinia sorbitola]